MDSSKFTFAVIALMTISLGGLAVSKFNSTGDRADPAPVSQEADATKVDTLKLLGRLNTSE